MPVSNLVAPDATGIDAVILYSGPGGTSLGSRQAGIERTVGVECEASAVATAIAAGLATVQADVRTLEPRAFVLEHLGLADAATRSRHLLLQASPPCQGLSKAGKGAGREDLSKLIEALEQVARMDMRTAARWSAWWMDRLTETCSDERSPLTFEVIRWIADLVPEYVQLEQVPAALPIWQEIAKVLEAWGYHVWCGNVQAEQFGVPQTRKRAMLYASRLHEVEAPVPTHSQYHTRSPERLDEGVEKWVSMAEALEWGTTDLVGFPRKYDGRGEVIEIDGQEYRGRDLREADDPSFVVTEKARSWKRYVESEEVVVPFSPTHMGDVRNSKGCIRSLEQPAPTMTASMDNGNFQFIDAANPPAKAIDRLNLEPDSAPRKARNGVRVEVWEAGVLQAFPKDYPWQGSKTAQFQQVGNAVPPLLQVAMTRNMLARRVTERLELAATA